MIRYLAGLSLLRTTRNLLYLSTSMSRHTEKDAALELSVLTFINEHTRPTRVLRDSALAAYYYDAYMATTLPKPSKPYYLYIWLCSREHRSMSVKMSDYRYFSSDTMDMQTMSYRDFTQMYADPIVESGVYNIHHTCKMTSVLYHNYPISLRSVLDNFPLQQGKHRCALAEGQLMIRKRIATLMEPPDTPVVHRDPEPDESTLVISSDSTQIRCSRRYTTIDSSDEPTYREVVQVMRRLTDTVAPIEHIAIQHTFSLPNREVNYAQVLMWMQRNRIPYSTVSTAQVTTEHLVTGCRCVITARVLDKHMCYDNGRYEVYRLKGDCVLEVTVEGSATREASYEVVLSMCTSIASSAELAGIGWTYQDPLAVDTANIAKLRATNSIVYDSMYCRKAPPQVQPMVIAQSDVATVLASGRMVLVYEGAYYTTVSERHKYIGMINRFGDYDPSKPYVPIIRTYRKNHLLSKKFKEFKAYLLRHSPDPCMGVVSPDDLLLPAHLDYLYKRPLINPPLNVASIHTKKTSVVNSIKVASGEVPDYVKSMLGTPDVRRVVVAPRGTGLLEACDVTAETLLAYVQGNRDTLLDLTSLTTEDIVRDITAGALNHRLYGAAIEAITGRCVVVFAVAGVVPYRCTKYTATEYTLLFLSDIGVYDRLTVLIDVHNLDSNVAALRNIVNSKHVDVSAYMTLQPHRRVDYTDVMLRLVSYIARHASRNNVAVVYHMVSEEECAVLVEQVYTRPIYYEGVTRSRGSKFSEDLVTKSRAGDVAVCTNVRWVCSMLRPLIRSEHIRYIEVYSPVDMSEYHLWDYGIEDCLYFSVDCYTLSDKEEVQYLPHV